MKKFEKSEISVLIEEIEKLRNLLALSLYHSGVPPLDIAKAAEISPNQLYRFITKTKKRKKRSINDED